MCWSNSRFFRDIIMDIMQMVIMFCGGTVVSAAIVMTMLYVLDE